MGINSNVPVQLHPDVNYRDMTAFVNENFRKVSTTFSELNFTSPDKSWVAPTFQNSWVNYGDVWETAGYRKDALGYVHLKGLVKSGTIGTSTAIFTLPAGYRPKTGKALLFVCMSNNAAGRINVRNNTGDEGKVCCETGNNAWVSLDGITFLAEA